VKQDVTESQPIYTWTLEKDIDVPMRDGTLLKADLFRPDGGEKFPVILNMGIYQKDKLWVPPDDLEEKANPYMNWETVNPEWWCPRGYAALRIDERGSGKSPGQLVAYTQQESLDFYDAIEWAAQQPWCSGAVGTLGISFFARTQWWVANLKPPSLKAIIPWEGAADQYRDVLYHGGIFGSGFIVGWFTTHMAHHLIGRAYRHNPDTFQDNLLYRFMRNNLDSGAFRSQQAQWDKIDLPMYAVGNWSGMALHLRGATEAYTRAASKNKKLRIHCGTHYHPFYSEEGRRDQLRFFDKWLKGYENGVMDEPPVKLAIRKGNDVYEFRHENEWPLARTQWTKYYLDLTQSADAKAAGVDGSLVKSNPAKTASRTYSAAGQGHAGRASASASMHARIHVGGLSVVTPVLEQDTEVTGPIAAQLYVSSTSEDMDIFITIRNIDADGKDVWETGQQGGQVPVAKGWLRVSHRELDPALTLPYRPYHKHLRRQWLKPGEIVKVDVEVWPTSMVFKKGHRIRVDIQARDGVGSAPYTHYSADYNDGDNTIYAGGDKESYLLLPIIP
jgi:putative CocE/NonD family hydrolase